MRKIVSFALRVRVASFQRMYVCMYVCMYVSAYAYVCVEREREREREGASFSVCLRKVSGWVSEQMQE